MLIVVEVNALVAARWRMLPYLRGGGLADHVSDLSPLHPRLCFVCALIDSSSIVGTWVWVCYLLGGLSSDLWSP